MLAKWRKFLLFAFCSQCDLKQNLRLGFIEGAKGNDFVSLTWRTVCVASTRLAWALSRYSIMLSSNLGLSDQCYLASGTCHFNRCSPAKKSSAIPLHERSSTLVVVILFAIKKLLHQTRKLWSIIRGSPTAETILFVDSNYEDDHPTANLSLYVWHLPE